MDLGTGKDLEDYKIGENDINYHLIDIADPTEEFSVYHFNKEFYKTYNAINQIGKTPVLVGGTGLYLHSVLAGFDFPVAQFAKEKTEELNLLNTDELQNILKQMTNHQHNSTDFLLKERIIRAIIIEDARKKGEILPKVNLNPLVVGINPGREIIKARIKERLKIRLTSGMVEEVKSLLDKGVTKEKLEFFGLEYKYLARYVSGEINYNDMFQKLYSAICEFAKKQMTYFRKMEREGIKIFWFEKNTPETVETIRNMYFE